MKKYDGNVGSHGGGGELLLTSNNGLSKEA